MVERITKNGKTYFACECCGSAYDNKQLAEKCEAWCNTHGGDCNMKIMEKSLFKKK
jgi:hypothetical protein